MKWPWVSRHALEVAEKYAAFLEGSLQAERSRNDALQERLLALKMTGAVEPPKAPTSGYTTLEEAMSRSQQPDELRDLIHERCGADLRKRALMLAQLRKDRADGVDDGEIARRIVAGVQSDGVPS